VLVAGAVQLDVGMQQRSEREMDWRPGAAEFPPGGRLDRGQIDRHVGIVEDEVVGEVAVANVGVDIARRIEALELVSLGAVRNFVRANLDVLLVGVERHLCQGRSHLSELAARALEVASRHALETVVENVLRDGSHVTGAPRLTTSSSRTVAIARVFLSRIRMTRSSSVSGT